MGSENYFDSLYSVKSTKQFVHYTSECTFDTKNYVLILQLHVSPSFTPSSGICTPRFKTYSIQ